MKSKFFFGALILVLLTAISYQNCSQGGMEVDVASAGSPYQATSISSNSQPQCLFNGGVIPEGGTVTAYLNSTPEFTGSCLSESRVCHNGVLSGSFSFANCQSGAKSCLFNGITVRSGEHVPSYSEAVNNDCASKSRTCTDGVLSDGYPYANCISKACLFNGVTLTLNQAFIYYTTNNSPCSAQTGYCTQYGLRTYQGAALPTNVYATCGSTPKCSYLGQTINANQEFTYQLQSSSCQSQAGYCDSQGTLRDKATQSVLTGPFCSTSTTVTTPTTTTPDSSTPTTTTTDPTFADCIWNGRVYHPGSDALFYPATQTYWACQQVKVYCGYYGKFTYYPPQSGTVDPSKMFETCEVIQQPYNPGY